MGCAGSKPAKAKGTVPEQFLKALAVKPYGVLGEGMGASGKPWETKAVAAAPDKNTLIVDPASINIISPNYTPSPADMGGAAGAIYRFLGITENENFPPDVIIGLRPGVGTAVYKRYGYPDAKHVVHVIGPDFKAAKATRQEAMDALTTTYLNVLRVARDEPRPLLRLLPISSGIYAGAWKSEMAEITADALVEAVERLHSENPKLAAEALAPSGAREVEMCVFDPKECKAYKRALAAAIAMKYGGVAPETPRTEAATKVQAAARGKATRGKLDASKADASKADVSKADDTGKPAVSN